MSSQSEHGYLNMELLRFTTAGSVDDGKSTLIGRLLYDSKAIFEDQLAAIEETSKRAGDEEVNLALLTDGLRAEREQGITIDVAYRYFATPKRKFIIADTPGHIQYTRNMVTGASTANLAVILIDARNGVLEQTLRHSYIASLLQIPHIIVCINKMDLVDYQESVFEDIKTKVNEFAPKLNIKDMRFVPICATDGDNIVDRSKNMDWYEGPTFMHILENIYIGSDTNHLDTRLPVQYVIRPQTEQYHDFRGYAGRLVSGVLNIGDKVKVLPSGWESTIKSITMNRKEVDEAFAPQSVAVTLSDDIDISRGNMIVKSNNLPQQSQEIDLMVCWFSNPPLQARKKYIIRHTTQSVKGIVKEVNFKVNISVLENDYEDKVIGMNDIARVKIKTTSPLFFDSYRKNRETGSLIFIDEATNSTVGAGMIL